MLEHMEHDEPDYERILIYGDPDTGKTRLATSLPATFGDILYYAADPGAEALKSVLERNRSRIVRFRSKPIAGKPHDPVGDAYTFATTADWGTKFPKAKTLVWDTMSQTSIDILQRIADQGQFSDKHIAIGSGTNKFNLPQMGDYMGAQNSIERLTGFLFQQPMHVIVICHSMYDEPQGGGSTIGCPALVGSKTARRYAGKFHTAIHLEKKMTRPAQGDPRTVVTAFTETHGIWTAKIREGKGRNPMPKVELDVDPVTFWQQYLAATQPKEAVAV